MEKKGDFLNQLAIISDLLERANLESNKIVVVFNVERTEFNRIYNTLYIKSKTKNVPPKDTFEVKIGEIMMVFNTNSV